MLVCGCECECVCDEQINQVVFVHGTVGANSSYKTQVVQCQVEERKEKCTLSYLSWSPEASDLTAVSFLNRERAIANWLGFK